MSAGRLTQAVSSPDEALILVDENDREIGFRSKDECHRGEGLLHRAFSVFLFNSRGEVLLQQRSPLKPLWPNYWSNSCCSHPHRDEMVPEAAQRRLREELGVSCELRFLYKFTYHARFGELGAEREYCWVYAGYTDDQVAVHPDEIADYRYVAPDALTREIAVDPARFTPWLKLEWQKIQQDFRDISNG